MNPLRSSCGATDCDTPRSPSFWRHFELAHQFEHLVALCDFLHREVAQTLQTEGFHAETGQHTSVDHCLAKIVEVHRFYCAREIAGHAAGERIPCPGRIVDVFEWICAATEEAISFAKQQSTVLTFFDGNVRGPHLLNTTAGSDEARFLGHFARFAVVPG